MIVDPIRLMAKYLDGRQGELTHNEREILLFALYCESKTNTAQRSLVRDGLLTFCGKGTLPYLDPRPVTEMLYSLQERLDATEDQAVLTLAHGFLLGLVGRVKARRAQAGPQEPKAIQDSNPGDVA